MKALDPIMEQLMVVVLMERLGIDSREAFALLESVDDSAPWKDMASKLRVRGAFVRAIILAEERAKPAAQRWAEMGDEEVAAMAKEMPAVASAWELIDEGDGLHGRRAYCVESSLLFASSRDEMRDVDSSNCGYRLIGGIPDAAPDAEVR